VGLVTEGSILEAVNQEKKVSALTAAGVMLAAPPIIPHTTPISAAVKLLEHVPLIMVQEQGVLIGLLTRSDLMKMI
jgi:predicted transcriptional regulator